MATPEIDITHFADAHGAGALVIDVRNPHEYDEVHVPGVTLIPMPDIPDQVGEIPTDRPVYVICATGNRSARVTEFLRSHGVDACNVAGGTKGWVAAGHPTSAGSEP